MQISSNSIVTAAPLSEQPQDVESTGGSANSSSSSTASATVTANDFLQLLVTELKNQDPTANTDPNEYINQLVQVNSLEQLISINQDLSPTSASTGSGSAGAGQIAADASNANTAAPAAANGNLSAPNTGASTSRIANALGTAAQTLAPGSAASPLDSVLSSLRARAQQAGTSTSNPAH